MRKPGEAARADADGKPVERVAGKPASARTLAARDEPALERNVARFRLRAAATRLVARGRGGEGAQRAVESKNVHCGSRSINPARFVAGAFDLDLIPARRNQVGRVAPPLHQHDRAAVEGFFEPQLCGFARIVDAEEVDVVDGGSPS